MTMWEKKLRSAGKVFAEKSTHVKLFIVVAAFFIVASGAIAGASILNNSSPGTVSDSKSSNTNKAKDSRDGIALGQADSSNSQANDESTDSTNSQEAQRDSTEDRKTSPKPQSNSSPTDQSSNTKPQPSTTAPKSDYNLNEVWYIATAGAEGLFNSCWPTALNETNEAQCVGVSNPYTHYWFEGVGVSKSATDAQDLAAAQVQQKADEKHVDLRRGGGDEATRLTESLCSTYSLSCGRW